MAFERPQEAPLEPSADGQQQVIDPDDPLAAVKLLFVLIQMQQAALQQGAQLVFLSSRLVEEAEKTNAHLAELVAQGEPDACPHCGASLEDVPEDANTCPSCGKDLEAGE